METFLLKGKKKFSGDLKLPDNCLSFFLQQEYRLFEKSLFLLFQPSSSSLSSDTFNAVREMKHHVMKNAKAEYLFAVFIHASFG